MRERAADSRSAALVATMIPVWVGTVDATGLSFAQGVVRTLWTGGLAVEHAAGSGGIPQTGQTVAVVPRALGGAGSVVGRVVDTTVDGERATLHVALVPSDQDGTHRMLGLT